MIWYEGDGHIVMSEYTVAGWTEKDTIVSSVRFFKNWADLPQIYHKGGDTLAVSWLEMSGEGTYDYDVKVSMSTNRGTDWSNPIIPHRDGIKGEHGFVSFFDLNGSIGIIWLDGRAMTSGGHDHGGGAMRLYTSTINPSGELGIEIMLDDMVCECCPTAAVNTSVGPLVAFRDRDDDETRNIQLAFISGNQPPKPLNDDGWIVPGCPVNGPAMEAKDDKVAITWYTAPDNNPQMNIAFSKDGGIRFGLPIRLDDGTAIGRTDLLWLDEENVLVSWLEEGDESGQLVLKTVNSTTGKVDSFKSFAINSGRGSGYPKLGMANGMVFVAWTEPGEKGRIQSEWISINK
ncbi:MAG: exo-alpha-sialidase [Candidatus Marinimicrobia bacterium]|nr:exo-alpha-sialidase [Candidatus Neomarinimicrobiota bacterium]